MNGAAKTICLNMIVKNEIANIERCLRSVVDHIDCWVIGDTGSTDGTQDCIRAFFGDRRIPGELHTFPFIDFGQARNEALDRAYASPLAFDYLLLTDADMELVVVDRNFRRSLTAAAYRVQQRAGISYWNTRLIRRDSGARYRGVTHEYVEVAGGDIRLDGVIFLDHASGSNRVHKFERDIRLLTDALQADPENQRYRFYLAQSYRDAGRAREAAETYAKRAAMGGWDEEVWYARWQQARCLLAIGDEAGFVKQAIAAFNARPHRAEPLADLARYYRERGMNDAAALFCEEGLNIPYPKGDVLFVDDHVYDVVLKEEFSIVAYYSKNPGRKERGRKLCEQLGTGRSIRPPHRDLARRNLAFYAPPVADLFPSSRTTQIRFQPPDGYHCLNPSVANVDGRLLMIQRTVNYTLDHGAYTTPGGAAINTRNFLLQLGPDFAVGAAAEIRLPPSLPPPLFSLVTGLEDCRLIPVGGELWCSATCRDRNADGWAEQTLARLSAPSAGTIMLEDVRVLKSPGAHQHEKNWTPILDGASLRFIYKYEPAIVIDAESRVLARSIPAVSADHIRGGSQAIPFAGGWLAICHEVATPGRRCYLHRFAWFDSSLTLGALSDAFKLSSQDIEYAAGLAWHPDGKTLVVSYGVADREAWLLRLGRGDIEAALALPG